MVIFQMAVELFFPNQSPTLLLPLETVGASPEHFHHSSFVHNIKNTYTSDYDNLSGEMIVNFEKKYLLFRSCCQYS